MRNFLIALCSVSCVILLSACGGGANGSGAVPSTGPSKGGTNGLSTVPAGHTVYFTSYQQTIGSFPPSFFAYDEGGNGTESPANVVSNSSAIGIDGIATDAQGNVYVSWATSTTNGRTNYEIDEYAAGSSIPIRTIAGVNTELTTGYLYLAVAPDGTIFVQEPYGPPGCTEVEHLLVFSPTSSGNVAPTRDIFGSNTRLWSGGGIAVDGSGTVYVAYGESGANGKGVGTILAFGPNANGNVAPDAIIQGSNTGLGFVFGVAAAGNHVDVVTRVDLSLESGQMLEFQHGANGNVAPSKTIDFSYAPEPGLAIDAAGNYVAYGGKNNTAEVFAPSASGAAAPLGTFTPTAAGCGSGGCSFNGQIAAF